MKSLLRLLRLFASSRLNRSCIPRGATHTFLFAAIFCTLTTRISWANEETVPWPSYHGGSALQGLSSIKLPDKLTRLWRVKLGGPIAGSVVADRHTIYAVSENGEVVALDFSGKKKWSVSLASPPDKAPAGETDSFETTPFLSDDFLIVAASSGRLFAMDARSGKSLWRHELGFGVQGALNGWNENKDNRRLIIMSQSDGNLHCMDLVKGKLLWQTGPTARCDGMASVQGSRIVFGSCASALHIFSTRDGKGIGTVPLCNNCQIAAGAAIVGDHAFAGTRSGQVYCVDLAGQEVIWANNDSQVPTFTTPAVNDDTVLVGSDNGTIFALDRATGKTRWKFSGSNSPKSPVIIGDKAAVSIGGTLHLFRMKDGAALWNYETGDEASTPAVAGGMILVGSDDGYLAAFGEGR